MHYRRVAIDRVLRIVRANEDARERAVFEARLRLALHLAPASAVEYDSRDLRPRWKLVLEHLLSSHEKHPDFTETLARDVSAVLASWQEARETVAGKRASLIRRDGGRCRCCHVKFDDRFAQSVSSQDSFKPVYLSPDELLSPEVDHIESISTLGDNSLRNLQLLCRFCNAGKGDGLGISLRAEAQYAGRHPAEAPRAHMARLVYSVLARDDFVCSYCGTMARELTVRKHREAGALVRSNLYGVCYECA